MGCPKCVSTVCVTRYLLSFDMHWLGWFACGKGGVLLISVSEYPELYFLESLQIGSICKTTTALCIGLFWGEKLVNQPSTVMGCHVRGWWHSEEVVLWFEQDLTPELMQMFDPQNHRLVVLGRWTLNSVIVLGGGPNGRSLLGHWRWVLGSHCLCCLAQCDRSSTLALIRCQAMGPLHFGLWWGLFTLDCEPPKP